MTMCAIIFNMVSPIGRLACKSTPVPGCALRMHTPGTGIAVHCTFIVLCTVAPRTQLQPLVVHSPVQSTRTVLSGLYTIRHCLVYITIIHVSR